MKSYQPVNNIMIAASIVLGVSGVILALVSMFGNTTASWPLPAALICVALGAALNIIQSARQNKGKGNKS